MDGVIVKLIRDAILPNMHFSLSWQLRRRK